jgi:DNA repair protein SbcC/Rad50
VIPQRVKLKGFLCYKEEQEIDFGGSATLWMLSGLNGSGKSSIFDAVTYALFGHHRGGAQQAAELINKDSDGTTVEFEFLLDGQLYRAKRTLKRDTKGGAKGTQQMFRHNAGGNGHGGWVAIEGTSQKRGFDDWVAENIGLNYETFTSSVLLLQGKAEKLLDSRPEGRREVLARIVDLERYETLHKKADDQRKAKIAELENLKNRLGGLAPVAPEEVTAAEGRIAAADAARAQARAEVERLHGLEYRAKAWVELQGRLAGARQRLEQARRLLGDAADIEKAVARLRELREVLPHLHQIANLRNQVHDSEAKSKALAREREKVAGQFAKADNALGQAREKRKSHLTLIAADEERQREVVTRFRESTDRMAKLKEYERQEADLGRVRAAVAELPADPTGQAAQAREAAERLSGLAGVLPVLARFCDRREGLRQALAAEQQALETQQALQVRGKQLAAEVEALRPKVEEAAGAGQQAKDRATETQTLLRQARESLREVTELSGAKRCRHCGQELTPGHLQEEQRRRGAAVRDADDQATRAATTYQAAQKAEKRLREQFVAADKAYQDARLEYRDSQAQLKQARLDVERLQGECAQAYGELPETFRARVSPKPPGDWLATSYPSEAELAALRQEADGLPAARQRLQQAEQVQQQWSRLKAQESASLQSLNRLQAELPADREKVRQEHTSLEGEEKALEKGLTARRAEVKEIERDLERLTKEREQAQAQLGDADRKVKEQELVQQHARQSIATALKLVPPSWHAEAEKVGMSELYVWDRERQELEEAGTDERGQQLQQARVNLNVLEKDTRDLEAAQDEYPPEARQDPAAVGALLSAARKAAHDCDEELSQARTERAMLENRRKQREEVEAEYLAAEGELATLRTLAELLGRDRLQLFLVRQAERQVVEHANAALDRLSGGQLYLRLSGEANGEGNAAKALDLEAYNRLTGDKPINVAFLSGSQKFRVAVSLALGIGQYASRQHRPIESVIIDEGFGCLDSQGRQVMIQELQNLRGQMRCILLVSHQEEFAEAFSDGYHFQLDGGATRVKRFQK